MENRLPEDQIENLYREMFQRLYIYAVNALGDSALAEEAVQETFCIACAKSDKMFACANPNGWLMATLIREVKQMRRQRAKLSHLTLRAVTEETADTSCGYDEENVDVLYGNMMNREDFQLLKRIVLDRYTMREAADELGISVEACKKRVQRAKKALKKKLSDN